MENKKHCELSNKKGTYAKVLLDNKVDLEKAANTMSTVSYKSYITELVKSNSNDTNAQRKFILGVSKKRNNSEILMYCWNAIMSADNLEVVR